MGEQKQRYTPEFRADAVDLVRRGERTLREVANALGVNHWTLREWCRQDAMKRSKTTTTPTAGTTDATETLEEKVRRLERENAQLKKTNAQLEMDRAILKKAAAFFAKESG